MTACDVQGTYLQRQQASIATVGARSAVMKHLGKTLAVPDAPSKGKPTGVSVTIPLLFGENPTPVSVDKPGLALQALMKFEKGGSQGKGPILYISAIPHAAGDLDAALNKIVLAVKVLHPKAAVVGPEEVHLESPSKAALDPMKHVSITGEQQFLVKGEQAGGAALTLKAMPGITEIYVVTAKEHYVIFTYRANMESSNENDLPTAIEASMRTVVVAR